MKERKDIFTEYINEAKPICETPQDGQQVSVHKNGKVKVMPSDDTEAEAWIIATTRPNGKELGV